MGLTYDGLTDTLTASTRNGSTLSIHDKDDLLGVLLERPQEDVVHNPSLSTRTLGSGVPGYRRWTWERLVNSSIMGFMQARMYVGE